jgi:hypothetical protein
LIAWRSRSVLLDLLVNAFGAALDVGLRSDHLTELLINQFAEERRRHGVRFVLAGITPEAWEIVQKFAAEHVVTADISVDLLNPANQIAFDGHPNGHAMNLRADSQRR